MPFPNKATQFKGGEARGRPAAPISKRRANKLARQKTIADIFGREPAFFGTNEEWLRKARDGEITPDWVQITSAVALQRWGSGDEPTARKFDLSALSDDERASLAILLSKVLGFDNKPTITAALPAPEPAPLRTERELLLAELAKHESAEEIARLRDNWPKE
jgi:hypothetical protein